MAATLAKTGAVIVLTPPPIRRRRDSFADALREKADVGRMREREPRLVAMLRYARDRVPARHDAPLVVDRPVGEGLDARGP